MAQRDDISNTFAAINYINLSKSFNSNESNDKINIKKVWDVVLNPTKYEDQINDLLENKIFSKIFFKILDSEDSIHQPKLISNIEKKIKDHQVILNFQIVQSNKNKNTFYLILTLLKDFKLL